MFETRPLPPAGVAGDPVPIRGVRGPVRGGMLALGGVVGVVVVVVVAVDGCLPGDTVLDTGSRLVGGALAEPASLGARGLFTPLNWGPRAGVTGLLECVFVCLSAFILGDCAGAVRC